MHRRELERTALIDEEHEGILSEVLFHVLAQLLSALECC